MVAIIQKFTLMVLLVVLIIGCARGIIQNQANGTLNESASDAGIGVTALSDDSIVVTGVFLGSATFGSGEVNQTILTSAGKDDIFIACYNPDGALSWVKRAGGTGSESNSRIAALSDNSTMVTGQIQGEAIFGLGEPNQVVLTSVGYEDGFIARYNPDGTIVWAKCIEGGIYDHCYGITTLSDNSAVVTGQFGASITWGSGETNQEDVIPNGYDDILIERYNTDGTLDWVKSVVGESDCVQGNGITTLPDDSIVVTGMLRISAMFGPREPNQTELTSAGQDEIFIACFNSDGSLAWAKRIGGADGGAFGKGISKLSDNSTVITGWFSGSLTFGNGESNQIVLTSTGSDDIFIARYNPDGKLAWAKCTGVTSSTDCGLAITALSDNSAVVTGCFSGSATFGPDEPNQIVLTSLGIEDVFIARYNPDGTLAWAKRAGGAGCDILGNGIITLSDDSIAVTGGFRESATFGAGEPNETILTSAGGQDMFIARYNPDGTLAWVKSAGGE